MLKGIPDTFEECLETELIREELHTPCKVCPKDHLDLFALHMSVVAHHVGRYALELIEEPVRCIVGVTDPYEVSEFVSSDLFVPPEGLISLKVDDARKSRMPVEGEALERTAVEQSPEPSPEITHDKG